jgi:putative ABC transport system substrate-binding protein
MKRREFIAFGGGFFWLPLHARAQNQDRPRRTAMMIAPAEDDRQGQTRVAAFRNGLQSLGWIRGAKLGEPVLIFRPIMRAELVKLAPE